MRPKIEVMKMQAGMHFFLQKELNKRLDQEDLKWQQRAKVNWLKLGDRNTKFFHASANQRCKRNRIFSITDEMGIVWESRTEILEAFIDDFDALFTTGYVEDTGLCLQHLDRQVSNVMNTNLLKIFTKEEVDEALN